MAIDQDLGRGLVAEDVLGLAVVADDVDRHGHLDLPADRARSFAIAWSRWMWT